MPYFIPPPSFSKQYSVKTNRPSNVIFSGVCKTAGPPRIPYTPVTHLTGRPFIPTKDPITSFTQRESAFSRPVVVNAR
jgi:hypothetical protein